MCISTAFPYLYLYLFLYLHLYPYLYLSLYLCPCLYLSLWCIIAYRTLSGSCNPLYLPIGLRLPALGAPFEAHRTES